MDIRRATPYDAGAMAILHVDSWRAAYHGLVPDAFLDALEVDRRAERFREALSAGTEETYLAEQDGDLVGMLTIGACRDEDVDQKITGEIWGIYLAPQYWRQGIGSALCRYGERLLASAIIRSTLWVFARNKQARRFMKPWIYSRRAAKMLNPGTLELCAIANP
jgi:ribosomal protein S18 acetylase RimI-like enzyme